MAEQRAKADAAPGSSRRTAISAYRDLVDAGPTEFTGSTNYQPSKMLGIFVDGKRVPVVATSTARSTCRTGSCDHTALRRVHGQIADEASIQWRPIPGRRRHLTDVQKSRRRCCGSPHQRESGRVRRGRRIVAAASIRVGVTAHTQGHSGTHMVHAALRTGVGPQRRSRGSLIRPGYLRFDFNWQEDVAERSANPDRRRFTERAVDANLRGDTASTTELEQAKAMGAMALFGEADQRGTVVEIGRAVLHRAVGGTHVHKRLDRPITILGAGVRRIRCAARRGISSASTRSAISDAPDGGPGVVAEGSSQEVPVRVSATWWTDSTTAEKELDRMRLANAPSSRGERRSWCRADGKRPSSWRSGWPGYHRPRICASHRNIRGRSAPTRCVIALIARERMTRPVVVASTRPPRTSD